LDSFEGVSNEEPSIMEVKANETADNIISNKASTLGDVKAIKPPVYKCIAFTHKDSHFS